MLGPSGPSQPVGVVAAIVPWNVPLFVSMLNCRQRSPPAARSC